MWRSTLRSGLPSEPFNVYEQSMQSKTAWVLLVPTLFSLKGETAARQLPRRSQRQSSSSGTNANGQATFVPGGGLDRTVFAPAGTVPSPPLELDG